MAGLLMERVPIFTGIGDKISENALPGALARHDGSGRKNNKGPSEAEILKRGRKRDTGGVILTYSKKK